MNMELCEHLKPIYQFEVGRGNEILSVAVNSWSEARLVVHFKLVFNEKTIKENINISPSVLYRELRAIHQPSDKAYYCKDCKMSLSSPLEENQRDQYNPHYDEENPLVIASKDTVSVPDDLHGSGMIPSFIE
jgi:hypothetical protein